MNIRALTTLAVSTATLALVAAGCGGGDGTGSTITADGSSTVGPFTTKAAEDFRAAAGVDVTVGISGTGGGFERFYRADRARASRGTGLGLAIVKHVVTQAGGTVEASGGRGRGLEIRCLFPATA